MAAWVTYSGSNSYLTHTDVLVSVPRQVNKNLISVLSLLSQAVQNGFWIVFEDINKAPSDVHSILLPLLEGKDSFETGHGKVIFLAVHFFS